MSNQSAATSQWIQPIGQEKQRQVTTEVQRIIRRAESLYQRAFDDIEVLFDLKGRTAGMYRVKRRGTHYQTCIRFNPWLFAKYPDDSWENTIPHEVAHYLTDCLYGLKAIRPHGKEWQGVMADLGAEPSVRARYDMTNIPMRQVKSFAYRCQCREVALSAYRHQKIIKGLQRYICRDCQTELTAIVS